MALRSWQDKAQNGEESGNLGSAANASGRQHMLSAMPHFLEQSSSCLRFSFLICTLRIIILLPTPGKFPAYHL